MTHLIAVWQAIKEGINVQHYLHWSTVDNLEWNEGYTKQFGLLANNSVTGKRTLRESAKLYKEIAQSGKINIEVLLNKYLKDSQKDKAKRII